MSKFIKSIICIVSTCVLFLGGCSNGVSEKELKTNKEEKVVTSSERIENRVDDSNKEQSVVPSEETEINENINTESIKQSYLKKLDELEADLKSSYNERYASSVTLDMIDAANKEFKQWDYLLNEIYAQLEKQLLTEEMDKLRDEELKWIEIRDEKMEESRNKFEGGSIAPFMAVSSLVDSTKSRCYELVNQYMK